MEDFQFTCGGVTQGQFLLHPLVKENRKPEYTRADRTRFKVTVLKIRLDLKISICHSYIRFGYPIF